KLDRNSGSTRERVVTGTRADGLDRMRIRIEVVPGIGACASPLTQHVEGIKKFAMRAGTSERLFDRLSQHKMRTEQTHGLTGRRAYRRQSEAFYQGIDDAFWSFAGMDDFDRETKRPGRGRYQERSRTRAVACPVACLQLVLDQAVG